MWDMTPDPLDVIEEALEFYRVNWNNYDSGPKLDRRPTTGLLEDAGQLAAKASAVLASVRQRMVPEIIAERDRLKAEVEELRGQHIGLMNREDKLLAALEKIGGG